MSERIRFCRVIDAGTPFERDAVNDDWLDASGPAFQLRAAAVVAKKVRKGAHNKVVPVRTKVRLLSRRSSQVLAVVWDGQGGRGLPECLLGNNGPNSHSIG